MMFRMGNSPWWLPGAVPIVFGVAIILFPELLALLVASALIFTGITVLALTWSARKLRRQPPKGGSTIYTYDRWTV